MATNPIPTTQRTDPTDIAAGATEQMFMVDGQTYTKVEMLSANQHDEEVCEWVSLARPGDDFYALIECL